MLMARSTYSVLSRVMCSKLTLTTSISTGMLNLHVTDQITATDDPKACIGGALLVLKQPVLMIINFKKNGLTVRSLFMFFGLCDFFSRLDSCLP